ncbi:MAG: class I SAM-dependent RNA methyltransferase [Candidatus Acidiferrales bacterium]
MDSFTVRVEKLVYGGDGLGYHSGKPVFVPFVLPGEVVEVFPTEESRKLIRGLPGAVEEPAAERIAPQCPYFARCGGCHYQHLDSERQLALKVTILRETLRRLGKVEWSGDIPAHPSPPWNYRNRIQLRLAPHPAQPENLQVGFHRAGSHTLCGVEQCPISSPKLNRLIAVLNRLSQQHELPLSLRRVEAFVDDRDDTLLLTLAAPRLDFDSAALVERLRTELDGVLSIELHETAPERRRHDGLGWIYYQVGPQRLRVSHGSFFQVNRHLLPKLVERVTGGLEGNVALDLYAGVGLFSRALADRFERVVAVESSHHAAADLAANIADSPRIEPRAASVEEFLSKSPEKCDAAVLDPPRTGLGREGADALLELTPPRLTYLSCDPATLARDLQRLLPTYRLASLELIDLFPQTFHIESLARLERA